MDEQLNYKGSYNIPNDTRVQLFPCGPISLGVCSVALVFIHPFISTGTCVLSRPVLSCLVFPSPLLPLYSSPTHLYLPLKVDID